MKFSRLILATNNPHKVQEISAILEGTGISVLTKSDLKDFPDIEETGTTLEENALLKARAIYERYGVPALADDTGLEVEFLQGAPGVYSARYAGEQCSFEDNNRKLLAELHGVSGAQRRARFVSVIGVVFEGGAICHRGEVEGLISESMQGSSGFGYDPVFYYPPLGKTYAQMTAEEKNRISHRALALKKFRAWLDSQGT